MMRSNEELFELRKNMEFEVLRNQFNPHMVFNVLESLRYTLRQDADGAERMVLMLSRFLRYGIYARGPMVLLGEDAEQLKNYMELQRLRYRDSMTYEILLPKEALEISVPKFFVQPFVENSIKHAFKARERFHVEVAFECGEGRLLAKVSDNGGGMPPERFKEVCAKLEENGVPAGHIGIGNMNRTLRLMFGEEHGVKLVNREGEGLTVLVSVPLPDTGGHRDV
jgi:LytS/YehU family sensor histidine kinase